MPSGDFIVGLGRRVDMIRAVDGPASARAGLNAEETALLQHVGAGSRIGDIIERAGIPENIAIATLVNLRLKGLVSLLSAGSRVDGSAAEMSEDVELDPSRKREVLDIEARLASDDYFALLGVAPTSSAEEIKRAYFDASKKFHPDRYYGKRLGTFAGRIDRIFRKLSEGFAILSDPAKRAAYLQEHPELRPSPGANDDRRAEERKARLAKHPYLARHSRVHDLIDRAAAMIEKDPNRAIADLSLASQYAPSDKRATELLAEARRRLDVLKAAELFDDANRLDALEDPDAALGIYKQAAQMDPRNASYADRAAKALLAHGGPEAANEARGLAARAVQLEPKVADYHATFASALSAVGSKALAKKEYEAALALDPNHAFAKAQLKKNRWPF